MLPGKVTAVHDKECQREEKIPAKQLDSPGVPWEEPGHSIFNKPCPKLAAAEQVCHREVLVEPEVTE